MALQAKGFLKVCINLYAFRSASKHNVFQFNRKARFLGKLLAEDAAERKQWKKGLITHKVYGASSLSPKRLETLNRIFLANITDGLTTCSRCEELADLGLLISRVELSKCGQSLKVLWSTCSAEFDEKAASILEESQGELRDNIVTKSVGGFVPRVIFSRDIRSAFTRDIEHILNLPSVRRDLETELPTDEGAEDNEEEKIEQDRFDVELSTNILGLRRDDILNRAMVTVKRLRRKNQNEKEGEDNVYNDMDEEIPNRLADIDARRQKLAIGIFMNQRARLDYKQFIHASENRRVRGGEFEVEDGDDMDELEREDIDEEEYDHDFMTLEENSFEETRLELESNEKRPTT